MWYSFAMQETQKIRTAPSDFFLHLGIIVALYISAINLVNLLFDIIAKVFPDTLNNYYDSSASSIRFAVASLIIMFPLYLVLGWIYNKQLIAAPEKKSLGVRKWLVYFTLFISGLTLAIDLIFLVFNLLGGETTAQFIFKVISVFVVAGLIFAYYLIDIRTAVEKRTRIVKLFAGVALVLVVGSIVAGFIYVGSPATQRKLRFDQQRVGDLQNIQYQVLNYWQQKGKLPAQLSDLNDPLSNSALPVDPETNAGYAYSATASTTFKLCATFDLPANSAYPKGSMPIMNNQDNWQHAAGAVCFARTIDPQLYPVRSTIK